MQTTWNYLLREPSYGPFYPKFHCHGNRSQSKADINDTVKLDENSENHPLQLKITILSYTQPKLCGLTQYLILLTGTIVKFVIFWGKN